MEGKLSNGVGNDLGIQFSSQSNILFQLISIIKPFQLMGHHFF